MIKSFIITFFLIILSPRIGISQDVDFPFWVDNKNYTPQQRLNQVKVKGVAIAIIKDYQLDTLFQWGEADPAIQRKVDRNTLFQAGTLSNGLTAIAILRASEQGLLQLDQDINQLMTSWQLPENKFSKDDPVTVRDLLTKSRGFTQASKPKGFTQGKPLPTLSQILHGEKPAKNKPIKLRSATHKMENYSFETEVILQQILEDIYQKPFAEIMQEQVLIPAQMTHSSFCLELNREDRQRVAIGFDKKGMRIKGDYWRYPELGSSGLWTTAEDYAKLLINLLESYQGKEGGLLKPETVKTAFIPTQNGKALFSNSYGIDSTVFYGGASMGFRTQFEIFPQKGWGVVVLMNSHENWRFMNEVKRGLKRFYGF